MNLAQKLRLLRLMKTRKLSLAVVVAILLLNGTGCITASIATIGSVLGALGSAASSGADVYKMGKLDAALMATLPETQVAVEQAARDLGLSIRIDPSDQKNNIWMVNLVDDQKREITISAEQRAERLSLCRVNVGIFGSEPTAKLVMAKIRKHLPRGANDGLQQGSD